jgi:predicted metal-binding membrane protein
MPFKARSFSWPDSILVGVVGAMVLLAWCALSLWGNSAYGHAAFHGHTQMMGASTRNPALLGAIFIAGWTVMTVAMMLPTSLPLILMFHRMMRSRRCAMWLVAVLVAGYVATWAICGVVLQFANRALQGGLESLPWITAAPRIGGAVLLTVAGLYQFSSLKYACLDKCHSPLSFLTSRWQGGNETAQALRIGVEHGLFCVGCCWSLMALMFLVGTGSVAWMLLLGVVMALEKNLPMGRRLSAPLGWLLLVCGVAVAVEAVW